MFTFHGGSTYTTNYSCFIMNNSGYISTYNYSSSSTTNSGTILTRTYSCSETINTGKISIANASVVDLGSFTIKENGILELNGLAIKANEPLHPATKAYLEKSGGTIIKTGDTVTLTGKFCVHYGEAKEQLPHMFGKYNEAKPGSEYIPGNWFSNNYDRVSSKSKTSGAEKLWRFKPITVDYNINTATADVFKGGLLHAVVKCDFVPKVKFDVFSKAVITREFSTEKECSLKTDAEINTTRNHALLKYVCNVLASNDVSDIESMLGKLLLPKVEPQNNGFGAWLQSSMGMFFSAPPKDESAIIKEAIPQDVHNYVFNDLPNNVSKEELISALHELIESISNDNFNVCAKIKESIIEDLGKVNCKFSQEEIDNNILPEIEASINNLKINIEAASQYVSLLELEQEKIARPSPM